MHMAKDLEEQYLLLEEEEKKERKRKIVLLIILFIVVLLIAFIGATFSYNMFKHNQKPTKTCTVNCDTDNDGKPNINIDYKGNKKPHFNIDQDGNAEPDFNLMNQDIDEDGKCDLNCDNNKDGWPDFNIDLDGDGIPDLNIKENGSKLTNMDTNGDGICDNKCNGITGEDVDNAETVILTMNYHDNSLFYIGVTKRYYAYNIIPGWKDVIEFKITNNSPINAYYRLRWIDVENTITNDNNITYKLSKNNALIKGETKAPYENTDISDKVMIPPNTTYNYKIELEFKETGIDQTIDTNKVFKATIKADAIK